MMMRLLAVGAAFATHAAASELCDPMTPPVWSGTTPTPLEVLGFELGTEPVTSLQADEYMQAVADASPRVLGPFALPELSVRGAPLNYVIVANRQFLEVIPSLKVAMALLRDPATPAEVAAEIIATTPPFTWMGACVHGGEKSGTDASLRMLYELADRTDCAASQIIDNQVLIIFLDGHCLSLRFYCLAAKD